MKIIFFVLTLISKLERKFDTEFKNDLAQKIRNSMPEELDEEHRKVLRNIELMFEEYAKYLSVFAMEDTLDEYDGLDEAILFGILKAQKRTSAVEKWDEKSVLTTQLKMALIWDRIDVANRFIFSEDKLWEVN
jgi:hypothetical protein